jgi:predicted unusual protein kinase regulating ubiquinone biosynthesis (AarF/ABC1/UbiB family)
MDIKIIRFLTTQINQLCAKYEYSILDFNKFLDHFQKGLVQELDFNLEMANSD